MFQPIKCFYLSAKDCGNSKKQQILGVVLDFLLAGRDWSINQSVSREETGDNWFSEIIGYSNTLSRLFVWEASVISLQSS